MAEKKTSTEGLPMFVETICNKQEWNDNMKKYPSTCHLTWEEAWKPKPNTFKWRNGMGSSLPQEEINNINGNLDYLRKQVKT